MFVLVLCGSVFIYLAWWVYSYLSFRPSRTPFDEQAAKQPLQHVKDSCLGESNESQSAMPSIQLVKATLDRMFSPFELKPGLILRNRIIKSATFESCCPNQIVSDQLIKFHLEQASCVGMTTVSYGCIAKSGLTFDNQLLLQDSQECREGLKRLTKAIHESDQNNRISMQLTHGGLMAENSALCAPSSIFSWSALRFAHSLKVSEIEHMIELFATAAKVCQECGFDAIELHCGHGYLLSQFLSLISNFRKDEYGCTSIENRCRFAKEIVIAIRQKVGPKFAILVKLTTHDGIENNGIKLEDSKQFAKILLDNGADLIVPTAGFILSNGIFMMRGPFPLLPMIWDSKSWIKKIGLSLVGPFIVPQYYFRRLFLWEHSLRLADYLIEWRQKKNQQMDRNDQEKEKERGKGLKSGVGYLGGVTSADDLCRIVESDAFDCVIIARSILREPDWPIRVEKEMKDYLNQNSNQSQRWKNVGLSFCDHQNRCIVSQMSAKPTQCFYRLNHDNKNSEDLSW